MILFEVKFACLLPWSAVSLAGERTVIDALKELTPQYIHSITTQTIKDVRLEERNGKFADATDTLELIPKDKTNNWNTS